MTRALRAVVLSTLVAGTVGLLRQYLEASAVRRGEASAPWAAVVLNPRRADDALASRLADWVPSPPRSRVGSMLCALWAAPLTMIGAAIVAIAAKSWRWDAERRCVVALGVRGPSALALRLVGADANTVGHVVLCRSTQPSGTLLDHEAVHVRQAERLGPLLFAAYVWLAAVYGYRDHPLERAARLGARRGRYNPML